ncbi:THUMP domain-containing protein [Pseudogulbenkiania ferrooxidans]|uniref:Putative RNA methylase n=1 Tax=Pseudogulbenkiania ferrooxidans 2002 TaxID=279714 RepID=B9Z217_9NEIS|nr:THUMP domain-containing protein [Pseudogulbenkiania ferrooxidans]EEG09462.1 putative RNA methylase [Pseudogulbenkiania ferrooxidans 2002]
MSSFRSRQRANVRRDQTHRDRQAQAAPTTGNDAPAGKPPRQEERRHFDRKPDSRPHGQGKPPRREGEGFGQQERRQFGDKPRFGQPRQQGEGQERRPGPRREGEGFGQQERRQFGDKPRFGQPRQQGEGQERRPGPRREGEGFGQQERRQFGDKPRFGQARQQGEGQERRPGPRREGEGFGQQERRPIGDKPRFGQARQQGEGQERRPGPRREGEGFGQQERRPIGDKPRFGQPRQQGEGQEQGFDRNKRHYGQSRKDSAAFGKNEPRDTAEQPRSGPSRAQGEWQERRPAPRREDESFAKHGKRQGDEPPRFGRDRSDQPRRHEADSRQEDEALPFTPSPTGARKPTFISRPKEQDDQTASPAPHREDDRPAPPARHESRPRYDAGRRETEASDDTPLFTPSPTGAKKPSFIKRAGDAEARPAARESRATPFAGGVRPEGPRQPAPSAPLTVGRKVQLSLFAPCPRGLEEVLAGELTALGAQHIQPTDGGVGFSGDASMMMRANLHSRTASRVLMLVAEGSYASEHDVNQLAMQVDWPRFFDVSRTIKLKTDGVGSQVRSLDFVSLTVKDAICDRFRQSGLGRPSVDTRTPDVRVQVFLTPDTAKIYLDTSGEPLFKRGWREETGEAPLRENLAAGILLLAGYDGSQPLIDPMCGSGTFLVEAADIALQRAPGRNRRFAFQRLRDFDSVAWEALQLDARLAEQPLAPLAIHGSDRDAAMTAIARHNLQAAGLAEAVTLKTSDVLDIRPEGENGLIVSNPPYGVRLDEQDALAALYPQLGDWLKQHFAGWTAYFFTGDLRLAKLIRLEVKRRVPLYNGALECRLFAIPLVAGSARRDKGDEHAG